MKNTLKIPVSRSRQHWIGIATNSSRLRRTAAVVRVTSIRIVARLIISPGRRRTAALRRWVARITEVRPTIAASQWHCLIKQDMLVRDQKYRYGYWKSRGILLFGSLHRCITEATNHRTSEVTKKLGYLSKDSIIRKLEWDCLREKINPSHQ